MPGQVDLSRADLNLLVLFEAVLQEGHVGRAADQLSLSPSAVSHGLTRLRRMFNDPLFLRTPKGVVPTRRAEDLAPQILEVLQSARRVIAAAAAFDPVTSTRRFVVGVPDGDALILPSLPKAVAESAPGVDLRIRTVMPLDVFGELEAGFIDLAVSPYAGEAPKRFHVEGLFEQDFVIVMRQGHAYAAAPGLDAYCAQAHAVMSVNADGYGIIDRALEELRRPVRRVALTLPSFLSILAAVEATDLLAAVPRSLALRFAERFGLTWREPPLALQRSVACAITSRSALADVGVAWLLQMMRDLYAAGAAVPDAADYVPPPGQRRARLTGRIEA